MKYKLRVESPERGVYVHTFAIKRNNAFSMKVLHCSDVHIDSSDCDRDLLKKHLEQADYVKIFGDLFDLMQSKHDKRRSYNELKEKYKSDNYIDLVVEDAVDFFKPYAKKIIFVSLGNHETSVIKNTGTNPISIFCSRLRSYGSQVIEGSYAGFQVDRFENDGKFVDKKVYYYHHGHGTNAQKTEGTLELDGDKARVPNADIVLKGDNHYKWHNPGQTSVWLNGMFRMESKVQHHIRLGTYKKFTFTDGWAVQKGLKPTSIGGWFINYRHLITGKTRASRTHKIVFDVQDAQ